MKPGVSARELKAAHRDLAKVWHPDRFLHDPRLRDKAQEKLKEINEAYELLSSGKTPRPTPVPPTTPRRPRSQRSGNWKWLVVPLFVFVAVFAVTTRTLLQRRSQPVLPQAEVPQETTATVDQEASTRPARKASREESAPEVAATTTEAPPPTAPTAAVETVTVTIDPESGLLAKPDCRLRSRMTYPRGSQPTGYCNLNHAPPPKESRIKSLAKTVRSLE